MTRQEREETYRQLFKIAGEDGFMEVSRQLALNDLYYLLAYVLGRDDIRNDWLYERCMEVQESPDGYLDLWARDHRKSTIQTFGKTIQDILNDPETTVGIFSATRPLAKDFLKQIKREFESNKLLYQLFPDILYEFPQKESLKWNEDDGIIVKRKSNPRESTVEAWGLVDGQPTGKHFTLLVYDDVVTEKTVTTPEMIKKTTDAWGMSTNLSSSGRSKFRYIGTRYHFNDTYAEMMNRGAVIPRIYPATDDGTPTGKPVFLSQEALDLKRNTQGPYIFACQQLLNPVADDAQGFKQEWLKFETIRNHASMNKYLLVDPAGEKKKTNDYTVMWVVALGSDGNYYVLDGIRDRLNLTERAEAVFSLWDKYRPLSVGYEKYGLQSDIEFIEYLQRERNQRFGITKLGGSTPKNDRIRGLVPHFENGRIFLPNTLFKVDYQGKSRDIVRDFVEDEFTAFPVGTHDDMLDCLARILDPELHARFPKSGGGSEKSSKNRRRRKVSAMAA